MKEAAPAELMEGRDYTLEESGRMIFTSPGFCNAQNAAAVDAAIVPIEENRFPPSKHAGIKAI